MKPLLLAITLWAVAASEGLGAEELNLPDPLRLASGRVVDSDSLWREQRRPEILELFRTHVYGRAPVGRPESLRFENLEVTEGMMEGHATRKRINIVFDGPGGRGSIGLVLFVPTHQAKPAPCFLLICHRDPENIDPERKTKVPFWPAEEIVSRGYAAAAFYTGDVDPDEHDGFKNGVHGVFDDAAAGRGADAWGTLAAWAWGASRALDYLVTDGDIDKDKVAVVGHSRGGKTALWAGAEDERFAMAISNESGNSGAALARRRKGETLKDINRGFPHWFCDNYNAFNEKEDELPVDQHMLIALMAPRLAYVASASEDSWADPEGEFLSCLHAGPVYALFGANGVGAATMPDPQTPSHEGRIGYHLRTGKHNLTAYDWGQFMDFADKYWK